MKSAIWVLVSRDFIFMSRELGPHVMWFGSLCHVILILMSRDLGPRFKWFGFLCHMIWSLMSHDLCPLVKIFGFSCHGIWILKSSDLGSRVTWFGFSCHVIRVLVSPIRNRKSRLRINAKFYIYLHYCIPASTICYLFIFIINHFLAWLQLILSGIHTISLFRN